MPMPGVSWASPFKASRRVLTRDLEWAYFWTGDKSWGRPWLALEWEEVNPRLHRQLEDLEWEHQEPWNFWEGEGLCKPKNWMKSRRMFTTQKRTEQTPPHSKASGETWWPFKDTGACGWLEMERRWKLAVLTGLILLVTSEELASVVNSPPPPPLHTSRNFSQCPPQYCPSQSLRLGPFQALRLPLNLDTFVNSLRIFIHLSNYDYLLLVNLKLGKWG